jgi:hypothetical protein
MVEGYLEVGPGADRGGVGRAEAWSLRYTPRESLTVTLYRPVFGSDRSSAATGWSEAVDLDVAVADLDALGVADFHVVLAGAGACLIVQHHERLGGGDQVGVVGRAELG